MGEGGGVVAKDSVLLEKIVEDDAIAELLERVKVDGDRLGALSAIALGDLTRDGLAVGDDAVDNAARGVLANGFEVVGQGVTGGFAGLGHEVGNVNAWGLGVGDGVGDFGYQEIGKDAGVKGAGTEEDEIGSADGFGGCGQGARSARPEREPLDALAAGGDAGFTVDAATVFKSCDEG